MIESKVKNKIMAGYWWLSLLSAGITGVHHCAGLCHIVLNCNALFRLLSITLTCFLAGSGGACL
jgi:hypothetical protein